VLVILVTMSACSIMPYNENFACEGDADYGRCTNVAGAYNESLTGEPSGPKIQKDSSSDYDELEKSKSGSPWETFKETRESFWRDKDPKQTVSEETLKDETVKKATVKIFKRPYISYKEEVYKELKQIISEPETPMVRQATQVRTLILTYGASGLGNGTRSGAGTKELYMPRYVYYMLDDAEWVLGDYLNREKSVMKSMFTEQQ